MAIRETHVTEQQSPKRQRCQFGVRALLLVVLGVSILMGISVVVWREAFDSARFARRFARAISTADRVVVRDGGFDCCGPVDGQKVLFEVTDPDEMAELREHLCFPADVPSGACMCCGYPGIDWYCGDQRVALTAVQHGRAIRWKGFPGDAYLTAESVEWLAKWLSRHGATSD